jgi:integrase
MATFNIVLDKRTKLKKDQYNLAIRLVNENDVMYLNIAKMTERQYEQVFIKKLKDTKSIEFRETCNKYITKCERIFAELKPFNKPRFRELYFEKDKEIPHSLVMKDLFNHFFTKNEDIKLRTRTHFKGTMSFLEKYKKGITVGDITPEFLKVLTKKKLSEGYSLATIDSHFRNIRRIINYFTNEIKLIPSQYVYPFGRGGYSISSFFPSKLVLKEDEIISVVNLAKFENAEQEYARDIWLFLYRCNGINFVDLLRMRWENIEGDYLIFYRKKTETTRKNNIKQIVVPIDTKLQELINKVGMTDSPFILGQMKDEYLETTFENKNHKMKQQVNRNLKIIGQKLNLSVPLKLSSARDCYATTLKRAGVSRDDIGEMLGHSNSVITEHYLASLDAERTFKINSVLL